MEEKTITTTDEAGHGNNTLEKENPPPSDTPKKKKKRKKQIKKLAVSIFTAFPTLFIALLTLCVANTTLEVARESNELMQSIHVQQRADDSLQIAINVALANGYIEVNRRLNEVAAFDYFYHAAAVLGSMDIRGVVALRERAIRLEEIFDSPDHYLVVRANRFSDSLLNRIRQNSKIQTKETKQ